MKNKRNAQTKDAGVTFSDSDSTLFQNFGIRVRIQVRLFFKFKNPTPVQTPATIIDPTVIHPCFDQRNDRTDSCYCWNGKVTPDPGPVFPNFLLLMQIWKNAESCQSRLRLSGSGPTSGANNGKKAFAKSWTTVSLSFKICIKIGGWSKASEMITIWFAVWISGGVVGLQTDTKI